MTNRGSFVLAVLAGLAVLALTGFAAVLVAGHHPWDGPVVFGITSKHGVNLGDLPVVAVWLVGTGYSVRRWRRA